MLKLSGKDFKHLLKNTAKAIMKNPESEVIIETISNMVETVNKNQEENL